MYGSLIIACPSLISHQMKLTTEELCFLVIPPLSSHDILVIPPLISHDMWVISEGYMDVLVSCNSMSLIRHQMRLTTEELFFCYSPTN